MLNLSFIKKTKLGFFFFFLFFTIFGFCFTLQTYGQIVQLPNIYIESIEINEIKDNQIEGQFTTKNYEDYYLNNLNYKIDLLIKNTDNSFSIIDSYNFNEKFFLAPEQEINKSFIYNYPKNIISGDYTLRVQIMTEKGSGLGRGEKTISLKGENKFLQIIPEFSKVIVDEREFAVLEGPGVNQETQKAIVYMKVKNLGNEITVIPNIKIFQRQVNMPLVKEYQESPITFAKDETKEIKFEMPKMDKPDSYLAEIKFLNNNEQVSGVGLFRWLPIGPSGKILNIKTDKDYFKAGENIDLTIESIGPADFSVLENGSLNVNIYDNEKLIGNYSKEVELNPSVVSSLISIPIKKDLVSPKIEVKLITKEGQILDEKTIKLPVFSEQAKQIQKNRMMYPIYILIALIILIVIFVFGFLVYKYRFKFIKR